MAENRGEPDWMPINRALALQLTNDEVEAQLREIREQLNIIVDRFNEEDQRRMEEQQRARQEQLMNMA